MDSPRIAIVATSRTADRETVSCDPVCDSIRSASCRRRVAAHTRYLTLQRVLSSTRIGATRAQNRRSIAVRHATAAYCRARSGPRAKLQLPADRFSPYKRCVVVMIRKPICTSCDNSVSYDFASAHGNGDTVDWCPRCRNGR